MSVFVELTTDAFQNTFNNEAASAVAARRAGGSSARRPTRGLEVSDDTYAILKVVDASGTEIPLIDSGSTNGYNTQYTNFILQQVHERRMEKQQIVETFGEAYIYFFGEQPRFLDVQAVLVDSDDFNWVAEFWANYEQYLRGTKCVEIGARVYLFYEDNVVEGYMLWADAQKTSMTPLMANMQFQIFITNETSISMVGDPNFPVRPSITLDTGGSDVNATQDPNQNAALAAQQQQQSGFGGGQDLISALQQGASPGQLSPATQGLLANAANAAGGSNGQMPAGLTRSLPLRSLIHDNTDEWTGEQSPAVNSDTSPDPSTYNDPNLEAQDLHTQAMQAMDSTGAMTSNPDTMQDLGLGPNFSTPGVGIGLGAASSVSASFSPAFNASYGASATAGLGVGASAGVGFASTTGTQIGFGASTGFTSGVGVNSAAGAGVGIGAGSGSYAGQAMATGTLVDQQNAASYGDLLGTLDLNLANALGPSTSYTNGVQTSGGVTAGVGVAGGVAGGLPPTILFSAQPTPSGGIGGIGNGANINVGGSPSCFAMASTGGTLAASFDASSSSFLT